MDRDWRGKFLKWISNMIEIKDIDLVDNQTLREKKPDSDMMYYKKLEVLDMLVLI